MKIHPNIPEGFCKSSNFDVLIVTVLSTGKSQQIIIFLFIKFSWTSFSNPILKIFSPYSIWVRFCKRHSQYSL